MTFPTDIGIVDLMVGLPPEPGDMSWRDSFAPMLKDRESMEGFQHPASYMFKNLPDERFADDPVRAVLAAMDAHGVERALITFEIAPDRAHWGVEIVDKVKAWAKALTGPTSLPGKYPQLMNAPGCETGPGPQLVTWGKSTVCSVDAFGFKFQWTVNSSKHIPFDWAGP